jgi:hypothetical protein
MIAQHRRQVATEVAVPGMTYIELPRALEAYFSFAELPVNERGRHFAITFSYMEGSRLDRLQWWWHASPVQQRGGEAALQALRGEAIGRFRRHIEYWLVNSGRRLTGGNPFPMLEAIAPSEPAVVPAAAEQAEEHANIEVVREYGRLAVGG